MKYIKNIIIIILLILILKKLFFKKRNIEKFEKIGFYKIQNSNCKDYDFYKLDSILSTEVGCYNACKDNADCGSYFYRNDSNYDFIDEKPINCFLLNKNKGTCEVQDNQIYEHYIKKDIDTSSIQNLIDFTNDEIDLNDVTALWSLILDPKTAGSEGYPFTSEELEIYNNNNINYNLFKHFNNNWYYDSKRLCVAYGFDNKKYDINSEECKWTVGIQGYWFKDIIDAKDTIGEAKLSLEENETAYAITFHPEIGQFGKYFIHSSSINLDTEDVNYNRIITYFYLPRNAINNSSNVSVLTINPNLTFKSDTNNYKDITPSPVKDKDDNNQDNRYILKFNKNSDTIFLGDYSWSNYKGRVSIYKFSNNNWSLFTHIEGTKDNSYFGYSLDVGGGSNYEILVVGAYYEDGDNEFDNVGRVYIYKVGSNKNWKNLNINSFKWGNYDEHFGKCVSLSEDGTILAVGADGAVINDKPNTGKVTIWSSNNILNNQWSIDPTNTLVGNSNVNNDRLGYKLKFSGDGKMLLISSKNILNRGRVYLHSHEFDLLDSTPILILNGKNDNDNFGCSLDINFNALTFVIGAHQDNKNKGYVNIYNKDIDKYTVIPSMKFYGEENNDFYGISVSLNKNADYLSISSKNGNNNKGYVKIYKSSNNYWNSLEIATIYNEESIYKLFGKNIIMSNNAENLGISYIFDNKPIFNIYAIPPSKNQTHAFIIPPNKTPYGNCALKNELCNKKLYYCAGGNHYGNYKLQRIAILKSASDILNNKEFRNCPSLINIKPDSNVVGIIVNPLDVIVKEEDINEVNIVLTSQPKSDVRLIIKTSIPEELILSNDLIIFNKSNWNFPQKLTIRGVNDFKINQDKYININFEIFSEDLNYNSLHDKNVSVLKINEDKANLIITPITLSVDEGKTGKIDVKITTKPEKDVKIKILNLNVDQLNLYNDEIIFSNQDWNLKKQIKFQGIIDNNIDGDQTVQLKVSVDSDDENYKYFNDKIIKINVLDNKKSIQDEFSHKCNLCTCLPNDLNNCKCQSCIKVKYSKLYEGNPDLSEKKIRKLISNFIERNNNLKKVGANTERLYFLLNLNRFVIKNGNNLIIIDQDKFINNREFQKIIKTCIENIFNIDFSSTVKVNLNKNFKNYLKINYKIYNIDNYAYQSTFYFKYTFFQKQEEYNLKCDLVFLYNSNERMWFLTFVITLPVVLQNV
jgi:hypothetical protein